jgi:plasmid replication initiation protein
MRFTASDNVADMAKKDLFSMQNEVVRRSNTTIAMSPRTSGNLTLLVRRLFNVMIHFTQKDGEKEVYRRPLRDVLRYIDYNSNDLDRIKEHLEAMATTPITWDTSTDDDDIWQIASLIADAAIITPKKKGLPSHLEWSFSPRIRQKLLAPGKWTQLSLVMHTKLKSGASVALFEIGARYRTSPGGLTMRKPYEWWVPTLTGTRTDAIPEYKYFKRDVLRPAIAEVNTHADFYVELVEHKVGNRVAELQFSIRVKPDTAMVDDEAPRFDGNLLERLTRLGMKLDEAQRICEKHDAPLIQVAIDITEKRAAKQPALNSKAAFFKAALRDGYKEPAKPLKQQQASLDLPDPAAEQARLREQFDSHRRGQALGYWRELDAEPAKAEIAAFLATDPPVIIARAIRKNLLETKAAETEFCGWLATKLWGEPTTEDLLQFALTRTAKQTEGQG